MASPSYTYTLANSTTADASQVMQDFNDILNGVTDGTKDLSISALTCAGTATLNGHVNLGNSSADDLTITASLASTLAIKTNNTYDIGSSTLGLRKLYLGNGGVGATCNIVAASHATTREYTLSDIGAAASFVMTEAAQSINGVKTFNDGLKPSSGSSTFTVFEAGSWTPTISFSGGNGTASASTATGRYIRINTMVFFSGILSFSKGTGSGTFKIAGLPANSGGVSYTGIAINCDTGITVSSPNAWLQAYIPSGGAYIQPTLGKNDGNGAANVTASELSSAPAFFFSGMYTTA